MTRFLLASTEGVEDVVAQDALALGARSAEPARGRVVVGAPPEFVYTANLAHPTTTRVLEVLHEGRIETLDDVTRLVREVDWPARFALDQSFAGDAVRSGEHAFTSLDVARAVGDGVCARFRADTGERPPVDLNAPDVTVHVDVRDHHAFVCLDTTGPSLHLRGYRVAEHPAPLAPNLASALVAISGWRAGTLLDPMCGSATIPIEAELRARRRAPNLARPAFAFQTLRSFDAEAFERARDRLACGAEDACLPILGNEWDAARVEGARRNVVAAGAQVALTQRDFNDLARPEGLSTVIANPPWGLRMHSRKSADRTCAQLQARLRAWASEGAYRAVVLVGHRRFEKEMPPDDARDVLYGGTPCRVLTYAL